MKRFIKKKKKTSNNVTLFIFIYLNYTCYNSHSYMIIDFFFHNEFFIFIIFFHFFTENLFTTQILLRIQDWYLQKIIKFLVPSLCKLFVVVITVV